MFCIRFCTYTFVVFLLASSDLFAQHRYWLQLMPNNELWFRVVTESVDCPSVTVDDEIYNTSLHRDKTVQFPVRSCKLLVPEGATKIIFNNNVMPSISKEVKRIFIIGDTGCRVKGTYVQDCKHDWPFKNLVDIGLEYEPDLVIHLGDYLYREFCRSESCKDEVLGGNQATWDADFFTPATSLLRSKPWLMLRGNHESCARAGEGWVHFFDYRQNCSNYTDSYFIDLVPGLRFIVADSSYDKLSKFQLAEINNLSKEVNNAWLFTHKPLWLKESEVFVKENLKPGLLSKNITTVFSGHVHLFQISERLNTTQVILGNGGSALAHLAESTEFTREEFGFAILEKQEKKGWQLRVFNVNNEVMFLHYINNVTQVN